MEYRSMKYEIYEHECMEYWCMKYEIWDHGMEYGIWEYDNTKHGNTMCWDMDNLFPCVLLMSQHGSLSMR